MHSSPYFSEVTQLITEMWRSIETFDYERAVRCMTRTCEWRRGGRMLVGREQVLADLNTRDGNRIARHQATNFTLEGLGAVMKCRHLLVVYDNHLSDETERPFSVSGPASVADCTFTCVQDNGVWLIQRIEVDVAFRRSDVTKEDSPHRRQATRR